MNAPTTHYDLAAWKEAMVLVEAVYRDTEGFPQKETFRIDCANTARVHLYPSNLAEGAARNSRKELVQFVGISCGSVAELETQLALAVRLGYLDPNAACLNQVTLVGKLVRSLRKSLRPPSE